jgi:serine/threonine-protein kinase
VVKYVASNKPAGTVLTQNPVAPQMVKSGTVVNLTVSGTQISAVVPNVVAATPAAAGALLKANNLSVGTQTSICSSFPGGTVASQSPAAGTQVPPNSPVNLVVSTGDCPTTTVATTTTTAAATTTVATTTTSTIPHGP